VRVVLGAVRAARPDVDGEAVAMSGRILVDQIIQWPNAPPPFDKGSCHLTIEGDDLEPLHAFAKRLGMKRSWFQQHPKMPHYDLTPGRRAAALRLGAVFVEARQQAIARRAARAAKAEAPEAAERP
jgi:hypothetical protein